MENDLDNIFFYFKFPLVGVSSWYGWWVFLYFFHFLRNFKWVHTSWLSHPPLPNHMYGHQIQSNYTHLLLEKMIKISNFDVVLSIN